jgi:hypothetical protein
VADVKIRISGLPGDVEEVTELVKSMMHVIDVSGIYESRGDSKFVRRYLTVTSGSNRPPPAPPKPAGRSPRIPRRRTDV